MNRSDMSWALQAVLPHAKTELGIDGRLVFATDRYTTGIAQTGEPFDHPVFLPMKEAIDLERFVRPKRKRDQDERVESALSGGELHIACGGESGVFDTCEPVVTLATLTTLLHLLFLLPPDSREQILDPQYAARFSKAQRVETDSLHVFARLSNLPTKRGIAIVTVGDNFVGAIAGRVHGDIGQSPLLTSLLQNARKDDLLGVSA